MCLAIPAEVHSINAAAETAVVGLGPVRKEISVALIEDLARAQPLPVFFTSHNMAGKKVADSQVRISRGRPIHYLEQDYLVISLPMQSRQAAERMNKSS